MGCIGDFPIFGLALLHLSNRLKRAMSPFYSHSTASDDWHRESERWGMERDHMEQRERCGKGYAYDSLPAATEIPPAGQSYEEFWAETTTLRDEWWPKWKREHGF